MKIRCSGDLYQEPIESNGCLECALKHNGEQPCSYGYPLLKAIFATQENENRTNEVHVTDITGCLLKAYLDKKNPDPPYPHDLLYLFLGIAIHDALNINDEFVESEISFVENGLHGRADNVFKDTLLDTKTTRWLTPSKLPYGEHENQVNIYNSVFKKNKLQIQYIDLSGPTKCKGCRIPLRMIDGVIQCSSCGYTPKSAHLGAVIYDVPSVNMQSFIDTRVAQLTLAMSNGTEPEAEPSFLCGYCAHVTCEHNHKRSMY